MKTTDTHIYFWGSVFSNFYPIQGDHSDTSENHFMRLKAFVFGDIPTYNEIEQSKSPMAAKRLGRKVKNFNEAVWDKYKYLCMKIAIQDKYERCPEFSKALMDSGNKILVEASPDDRIWGIGFDEDNAEGNEEHWGENLLGKALMEIRGMNRV